MFMGKYIIKGMFGLIEEKDASEIRSTFQDSELQEFIKSKIGKNKNITSNEFSFTKYLRSRGTAHMISSYDIVDTRFKEKYCFYLYLDRDGDAYKLEVENINPGYSAGNEPLIPFKNKRRCIKL
jgi:hypothetical protein